MKIQYHKFDHGAPHDYGPGVDIELTGNEVATAIMAYLVAQGVHVSGPKTISVNGELCEKGGVYIDPSGFVIDADGTMFTGRGPNPPWLVGMRVQSPDPEDNGAQGTVIKVTPSGLHVEWEDGHCTWCAKEGMIPR